MSERPILITGAIRSGTTWVGQVLARAPGMAVVHEPFNIDHPQGVFAHHWPYQYAYVQEGTVQADEVAGALDDTLSFRYRPMHHLRSFENVRRTVGMARDLPRFWYRRVLSRPRVVMKDPIAFFSADWLSERFDMDVVVMVRHPAAFAWSYLRISEPNRFEDLLAQPALMEGLLAPLADEIFAASRDVDPIRQASTLWRAVYHVAGEYLSSRSGWRFIRHEDLSLDPLGEFPKLFLNLDLDFTSRARRYLERTSGKGNPVEAPPGVSHELHRNSRRNVSAWKRRLPAVDVVRIRRLTADIADRFYEPASWE